MDESGKGISPLPEGSDIFEILAFGGPNLLNMDFWITLLGSNDPI